MRESRTRVGGENPAKLDLQHGGSDLQSSNAETEQRERRKRKGRGQRLLRVWEFGFRHRRHEGDGSEGWGSFVVNVGSWRPESG